MNYEEIIKKHQLKPKYFANGLKSFVCGGMVAIVGQLLLELYIKLGIGEDEAGSLMITTVILVASLLTAFGVYDKLGQFAKAGLAVPVTGFANSMTASALEYKKEGMLLGIANNLFKLAGAVIVYGVVSAYILGIIRYLFMGG